jgi:hypothetical protein
MQPAKLQQGQLAHGSCGSSKQGRLVAACMQCAAVLLADLLLRLHWLQDVLMSCCVAHVVGRCSILEPHCTCCLWPALLHLTTSHIHCHDDDQTAAALHLSATGCMAPSGCSSCWPHALKMKMRCCC